MNRAGKDALIAEARPRLDDFHRLVRLGLLQKKGDFFPSVHYPPITMYKPITQEAMFAGYRPADGLFDLYAHIPFCHRRCLFCHYPGKFGANQEAEKEKYLDAMEREMDLYMGQLGLSKIAVRSILLGGGTPTYLTPAQLDRFLKYFTARLDREHLRQFNYDVDPATLIGPEGEERLRIMRDYGVDRLTIGVQSLDEDILKLMNRPHDKAEALRSIENSLRLGYQVNIEFIFGHPGETLDNWIDVIEEACGTGVHEIQLYRLKVEAYGDFQGSIKKYKSIHPDDCPEIEDTLIMKQTAILLLARHGYHENIRRVFSRSRKHFSLYAHNQCCLLRDEIGLGLTAFSSLHDRFVLNTQTFEEYYQCIAEGRLPLNRGIVRSAEEQMRWAIILPLKNREVKKSYFRKRTGASLDSVFRPKIEALKEHGLLEEDEAEIRVTPLGAFFADEVAEQFQHPDYIPFPPDQYEDGPLHPLKNAMP